MYLREAIKNSLVVDKKEPSENGTSSASGQPAKEEEKCHDLAKMDFRVGKIISCVANPDSEKLYNEVVDIGGGVHRNIGSGL